MGGHPSSCVIFKATSVPPPPPTPTPSPSLQIQRAIRTVFKDSTVITVAHRLATIVGGDYVLVMDRGRMGEFGPPDELLRNPDGLFSSLVAVRSFVSKCRSGLSQDPHHPLPPPPPAPPARPLGFSPSPPTPTPMPSCTHLPAFAYVALRCHTNTSPLGPVWSDAGDRASHSCPTEGHGRRCGRCPPCRPPDRRRAPRLRGSRAGRLWQSLGAHKGPP